ncbi:cell elongation-specific peptidoglycan biosynthesis regulator RodA [Frondihabitans sp. PhB188]|uniref:FtsW/RodA/SpoVE family cell cycle protein n=1 Tax=Frondihabitans sp. PhB188 TaxID=2485200 RepID=UPI000F49D66F|nr:FtsW/RodA/SpoVE family cell cycle protein [Frondihabitans sp. PhB188]ROQ37108.1 cell elongation-specific peptidoglycan biosynthesis regulator RodA [Frondihabitans sp. PhB188]
MPAADDATEAIGRPSTPAAASASTPAGTNLTGSTLTQTITIRPRQPARLRNIELPLLIVACGISAGAMLLVQLGALGEIRSDVLWSGGLVLLLALVLHVVLRVVARDADPFVLPIALTLNGLGIAEIYRIDIPSWSGSNPTHAGERQILWTTAALVVAIIAIIAIKNYRILARYRYIAMFVSIVFLLLPLVPGLGRRGLAARVWIDVGPLSFQPGEIAKITLAIFFAGYLVQARDSLSLMGPKILGMRFPRPRDLGPILIIWGMAMVVLVFEKDLGTSLLYFGLFLVMIYVATGKASWVVLGMVLFVGGAIAAALTQEYVHDRFEAWLNPLSNSVYGAPGGSYQLVTGLFGLANGGLIGTGFGQGSPGTTPLAQSDYIIASLGEELGLAGLIAILGLYILLVSRGFRIGFVGTDDFGRLLGVGLSFIIALQVFVVMGGVTRVIPLTGLTMPFLAAGGSSLLSNWIIVALILRLSDGIRTGPRAVVG